MDKSEEKTVLLDDEEDICKDSPPPYSSQSGQHCGIDGIKFVDSRLKFSSGACNTPGCSQSNERHCHLVIEQPVTAKIDINPTQYILHSWLGYAVCVTIFCCLPTGLLAILTAVKANEAADKGEMQKAVSRSRMSRNLIMISLFLGLILWSFGIYCVLRLSYELVHNDWGHDTF